MLSTIRSYKLRLAILFVAAVLTLSCRTATVIQSYEVAPTSVPETKVVARPTFAPTFTQVPESAFIQSVQAATPVPIQQVFIAPTAALPSPTAKTLPTQPPVTRAPVRAPTKTRTPTQIPATPTPSYLYHVNFSWCGPNWQTFVEGTVSQDSQPKNGLLVRISMGPDGLPGPGNDYRTGTDPAKPGGYTQIIDANAPHEGTWYLWVVDPQTKNRVSDIAIVKTDPKHVEEKSCQSATVNFSN